MLFRSEPDANGIGGFDRAHERLLDPGVRAGEVLGVDQGAIDIGIATHEVVLRTLVEVDGSMATHRFVRGVGILSNRFGEEVDRRSLDRGHGHEATPR